MKRLDSNCSEGAAPRIGVCRSGFLHHNSRRWAVAFCTAVSLVSGGAAAGQTFYSIEPLGIPSGATSSAAAAINDSGQVAGYAAFGSGSSISYEGLLYSGGSYSIIPSPGGASWIATAINGTGQVAGYGLTSGGEYNAFLYSGGSTTPLGSLGGALGQPTSNGAGIDTAGDVVGSSGTNADTSNAFLYSAANQTMNSLGTLGGTNSYAFGIDPNGNYIVGYSSTVENQTHAFLWSSGGTSGVSGNPKMQDLGTLGGANSFATAVNNSGDVVGYSNVGTGTDFHAFFYNGSIMQDLGDPDGFGSSAQALNASGVTVGYYYQSQNSPLAFVAANGSIVPLDSLVVGNSGWTLQVATGINTAGDIVGYGTNPGGQTEAFELTPTTAPAALTWDPSTNHTGSDGTGNWDTTTAIWANGTGDSGWVNGAIASIGSSGAGATITIDAAGITADGLAFDAASSPYTIAAAAGDNLTLSGTVTVNANATISAPIVGSGALTITGPKILTLSGANTYTGGATLQGGVTVAVASSTALGSGGVAIDPAGVTIQYAAPSLNVSNNLTLNANATIDAGGFTGINAETYSGVITNNSDQTLTLQNGTLNLTGTNNSTSAFTTGTLQIGNGSAAAIVQFASAANLPASSAAITLNSGGLAYTGTASATIDNPITLSGTIDTVDGGGLSGTNTLTIASQINGPATTSLVLTDGNIDLAGNASAYTGSLVVGGSTQPTTVSVDTGSILPGGDITINNGTLRNNTGGAMTITNAVTLASVGGTVDTNSQTITLTGPVSGTGDLTIIGGGTVNLAAPATYTGPTSIQSGNLTIGAGGTINGTSALAIAAGAKLNLANTDAGNGVIIDYGSGSSPNSAIQDDVANGAITTASGYAVGYADGSSDGGVVSGLSAGQEKIMATLPGDTTLAGTVNLGDVSTVYNNVGITSGATWVQGDFTASGSVTLGDLTSTYNNVGLSLASGPAISAGTASNATAQPIAAVMARTLVAASAASTTTTPAVSDVTLTVNKATGDAMLVFANPNAEFWGWEITSKTGGLSYANLTDLPSFGTGLHARGPTALDGVYSGYSIGSFYNPGGTWNLGNIITPGDITSGSLDLSFNEFNASTGAAVTFDPGTINYTAVPEPATLALFAFGVLGLILRKRGGARGIGVFV